MANVWIETAKIASGHLIMGMIYHHSRVDTVAAIHKHLGDNAAAMFIEPDNEIVGVLLSKGGNIDTAQIWKSEAISPKGRERLAQIKSNSINIQVDDARRMDWCNDVSEGFIAHKENYFGDEPPSKWLAHRVAELTQLQLIKMPEETPIETGDRLEAEIDAWVTGDISGSYTSLHPVVDRRIGGGAPHRGIVMIAAPSGAGKSAMGGGFVYDIAYRMGNGDGCCVVFQADMKRDDMMIREASRRAQVDAKRVRTNHLEEPADQLPQSDIRAMAEKLKESLRHVKQQRVYIVPKEKCGGWTAAQMATYCHRKQAEYGKVSAILIDHSDKFGLLATYRTNDQNYMTQFYVEIGQQLAQFNCPVIVLHQLNRQIFHRADPTPKLSDIRMGGETEVDTIIQPFLPMMFYEHMSEDTRNKFGVGHIIPVDEHDKGDVLERKKRQIKEAKQIGMVFATKVRGAESYQRIPNTKYIGEFTEWRFDG